MARSYEIALAELEALRAELETLNTISEEEACYIYNVDSKADKMIEVSEDIEYLEKEVEYLAPMDWSADPVTEIFGTYEAMNSFLY